MQKISFKQYFESKQRLKAAGEDCPKYFQEYVVSKYCKLPLLEDINSEEKVYVALKPKDKVEIFWEVTDLVHPIPRYVKIISEEVVEDKKFFFSWNLMRVNKWLELSTFSTKIPK